MISNHPSPDKSAAFFGRTDKSVLGRWWWSIDRWTLFALGVIILMGIVLVTAASPSVAERLGLPPFYFVYRHIAFLVPTVLIMLATSFLNRKMLWRVASVTLVGSMALTLVAIFCGVQIKGATRWVHFAGMSIQPSEFIKPAFAITSAWLIARQQSGGKIAGQHIATAIFGLCLLLLLSQPDLGMSFVLSSIWAVQIFLSGLPMFWVFALAIAGAGGLFGAYLFFPHVTYRVDRFLDPAAGDNYQVTKSLEAFSNGGLFGTGPGHGVIKLNLPDAHADFIFSVAGEEFGLLTAIFIVLVYCFILLRSIWRVMNSDDMFILLGTAGMLTQFCLQSLIHMGSSLQLLPAKGMTLPFISYGGSSLLSLGLGIGMLLALTRKRTQASPSTMWRNWTNMNLSENYG